MRVSDAVVERLAANGIEAVFGIPGTQTLPLNEGVAERPGMRFVMARHETAVSHQAWGYAETSGRPAATLVIPGPGDLNAMNGLKNAYNDGTPLVHLSVETDPDLRGTDAIHETPPGTYDTVVKENVLVESPESAPAALERAIAAATTPPTGPVRVGIPKPFLRREIPEIDTGEYDRSGIEGVPEEAIAAAADRLREADRPVVLAGGGVRRAGATGALRAIAERLDAPVVTTYKGKGTMPEDDDRSAGVLCIGSSTELLECLAEADVGLAVGTDLDSVATRGGTVDLPRTLIHVTLDPDDLGASYEPSVGIVADADRALEALRERLPGREGRGAERARAVREADGRRLAELREEREPPLPSASVVAAVREALPRDAIVAIDAGGFRIWTLISFPVYGPRSCVTPGSWATMGTGLPSAIGAATAHPEADVAAITGDGGLMMCLHELHTLAAEDLDVTVVVLNNEDYAIISEEAAADYGLDPGAYGWGEAPISFSTVAEGLGLEGVRAETPAAIREAVAAGVESDRPTLVEVPTDPEEPQASRWMSRDDG